MNLIVSSTAFASGKPVPRRHSGDGEDLSPPLAWSGVPSSARELALIVDDPDAPTPEPWVHWVIYKIPVTANGLAEGVPPMARPSFPPTAVQGKNSFHNESRFAIPRESLPPGLGARQAECEGLTSAGANGRADGCD